MVGSPTGSPVDCFQLDPNSCVDCVVMESPQGYQDYLASLFDNCICSADCVMACQMECASPQPFEGPLSPMCDDCFQNAVNDQGGACIQGFQAQCQASLACVQFVQDLQMCN